MVVVKLMQMCGCNCRRDGAEDTPLVRKNDKA